MPKNFFTFVYLNLVAAIALAIAAPAPAHEFRYTAKLTGSAELPSNASTGLGYAVITLDEDLATLRVQTEFNSLLGTVTAAHIHAPTAAAGVGVAGAATQAPTFEDFPSGVTAGTYDHTIDLAHQSSYNPDFFLNYGGTGMFAVSNAMNALIFALDDGKAYLDIHTTAFGGGEIRGFLSYVAGDFNDNGNVDAGDYVLWAKTKGETGDGLSADANNDFAVDDLDYGIWRQNFGNFGLSTPPGSGAVALASIPEPGPISLIGIVFFVQIRTRRA